MCQHARQRGSEAQPRLHQEVHRGGMPCGAHVAAAQRAAAGPRYLSQSVSFAEGLVGHVPELLGHGARAPARRVVLDHGGHELRHFLNF